jgi:hypothetical protein
VKSKQRIPFSENDLHHVAGRPDIAATTALLRFVSLIAVLTPPLRASLTRRRWKACGRRARSLQLVNE